MGDKAAAAQAKLEQSGPYGGMSVRKAMSVVLRVLQDVLQDEFSLDRLEMLCVESCGGGGDVSSSGRGGAEAPPRVDGDENSAIPGTEEASASSEEASYPRTGGGGADAMGGLHAARKGGLFRRVGVSEMERLLLAKEAEDDGLTP